MLTNAQIIALGVVTGCALWYFKERFVGFVSPKILNITHISCPFNISKYIMTRRHMLPVQIRINGVVMSNLTTYLQEYIDVDQRMRADMGIEEPSRNALPEDASPLRRRVPSAPPAPVDAHLPAVLALYETDAAAWISRAYPSSESIHKRQEDILACEAAAAKGNEAPQPSRLTPSSLLHYSCSDGFLSSLYADTLRADGTAEEGTEVRHPLLLLTLLRQVHISLLVQRLEHYRTTAYSSANDRHEHMLCRLWEANFPDEPFQPRGAKWGDLGFQGLDPATDFRGGGVLALHQLVAFAQEHPRTTARYIELSRARGIEWFGLAITGINVTVTLLALVAGHQLDSVFFKYGTHLRVFDGLFATALVDLADNWDALQKERERKGERNVTQMDFPFLLRKTMEEMVARAQAGKLRLYDDIA